MTSHHHEPWQIQDGPDGRYCAACGESMTCVYVTSLGRECGRRATTGEHCDFHVVIAQLDDYDFHEPAPIVVPASVRPMVDRILSDVQANFDAMPRIGSLLDLTHVSMNRREDLRIMRGNDQ